MNKKSLALSKGGFSIAILLGYLAFCAFFFTYGLKAFQRAAEKLSGQQTLGGLAPAFALTFALIALCGFILPALLFLISSIGNFVGKGNKLSGFTAVSLIAEILAIAILFFLSLFFLDGTLYDGLAVAVTLIFDGLVLTSFIHSVIVLVKGKTADEA